MACVRPLLKCALAVGAAANLFSAHAIAQSWPVKPVRVIVPFSPGGGTDIQGRALAEVFYADTGETFVVDNRAGASGLIGTEVVATAPPDGYTLLFSTASLAINTTFYASRLKFDPVKDLAPISWLTSTPLVLATHPSIPAKSVPELIQLAKQHPGELNSGVNTLGTTSHLSAEMFKQMAGIQATIVPYKGGGSAMLALMTGEIDYLFATGPVASNARKTGRVRLLAVTTAKRASAFPDLPTMNTYFPGFESDNWYAMWFPAGTSPEIIDKMHDMIVGALKSEKVRDFMAKEGLDAVGSTPAELDTLMKRDIARYARVFREANIKLP